jgi:hypothetical protein
MAIEEDATTLLVGRAFPKVPTQKPNVVLLTDAGNPTTVQSEFNLCPDEAKS